MDYNSQDSLVTKYYVNICDKFVNNLYILDAFVMRHFLYILWNHFNSWDQIFVDCRDLTISLGCNFKNMVSVQIVYFIVI